MRPNILNENVWYGLVINIDQRQSLLTAYIYKRNCEYEEDAVNLINSSLVEHIDESRRWLAEIPTEFKDKWENLSESKKNDIVRQTSNYTLQSPYQIKWFWETRNFDEQIGFVPLLENKNTSSGLQTSNNLGYIIDDSLMNEIGKRFGK